MRNWRRWGLAEGLVFFLLALAATWPLARQGASSLPLGMESSGTVPLFNAWTVWWNAHCAGRLDAGYWDAPIFFPTPGTFAFSEPMPTTVVVAPLIWLGGWRILAYNAYIWLGLTLNGWAAFLLLRDLRLRWLACLLGGGMLELLPLVHSELGVVQMVPLCGVLWTIHLLVRFRRRPRWRRAVLLGAAFAVAYLSCAYYGLFLSLLLPVSGGWLLGRRLRRRRTWGLLLIAAGVGALLTAPVVAGQWRVIRAHQLRRPVDWVSRLSADPEDYAVTPWPQWFEPADWAEWRARHPLRLGLGVVKVGLAVAGAVAGLWWRHRAWTAFCLTMLLAAFLFSLGPKLSLGGFSPYVWLMGWYPGLGQARNVYRFAVFVQLAAGLLGACGLQAIVGSGSRVRWLHPGFRWAATIACGLIAIGETFPPAQPLFPVPAAASQRGWIEWLQSRTSEDSVIVCLPFPKGTTAAAYEDTAWWLYWGSYHRRRLVNGYSGFFPQQFLDTKARLQGFPDAASLQRLRELGVGWCVVDRDWQPREAMPVEELEWVYGDDAARIDIYRLRPSEMTGQQGGVNEP